MRWSQLFIPTLRETPAEAEVVSHQLLLRAGYIRQLASGIYSYLFLAKRSLLKIERIVREEMDSIGAQEFHLPELHPAELWQQSGRWEAMGSDMFRLRDRWGRDLCLGMTEEEVMTSIRPRRAEKLQATAPTLVSDPGQIPRRAAAQVRVDEGAPVHDERLLFV